MEKDFSFTWEIKRNSSDSTCSSVAFEFLSLLSLNTRIILNNFFQKNVGHTWYRTGVCYYTKGMVCQWALCLSIVVTMRL